MGAAAVIKSKNYAEGSVAASPLLLSGVFGWRGSVRRRRTRPARGSQRYFQIDSAPRSSPLKEAERRMRCSQSANGGCIRNDHAKHQFEDVQAPAGPELRPRAGAEHRGAPGRRGQSNTFPRRQSNCFGASGRGTQPKLGAVLLLGRNLGTPPTQTAWASPIERRSGDGRPAERRAAPAAPGPAAAGDATTR